MKRLFLTILIILFSATWAGAATHTVCASGCTDTTIDAVYAVANCGDTIEIQDSGTYTYSVGGDPQLLLDKNCTVGNELTIQAQSGQTPIITRTSTGGGSWIEMIDVTGNYHIFDGIVIGPLGRGNGVEIAGDNNTFQNNTFDQICTEYLPNGTSCECLRINGGDSNIIQDNTFEECNHSAVLIDQGAQKNQILNNTMLGQYGHGVNLIVGAIYNLVDGNEIANTGELSDQSHQKTAIQISGGSNNSIRRNVIYDQNRRGMELSAYSPATANNDDNWIYNNTFYNIGTDVSGNGTTANNTWIEAYNNYAGASFTGNKIYNNIADKVGQDHMCGDGYEGECLSGNGCTPICNGPYWHSAFILGFFSEVDPGPVADISSHDFGGNHIKNNAIRMYHDAAYNLTSSRAIYYMSAEAGSDYQHWTVTGANGQGSWSGNITDDPQFASTNTSTSNWWYLQGTSATNPLIDGGVAIDDPNALTGGWSQLTYSGSAPDIGAYETGSGGPTVTGATIDVTGLELTLNISETVDVNNNTGWTINTSYSPIPTVTYQGGTGTAILVYDISRSIYADETVTVSYNKPAADAIESVADEDLESFGPTAVTNNSGVPHVALSGGVGGIGSFGGF